MSNPGAAVTSTFVYGLGAGAPAQIGNTPTSLVGFYGTTPVVQPTTSFEANTISTAATSTTPWGFATSTQANSIVTLVNQLRNDLVSLGIIKGS